VRSLVPEFTRRRSLAFLKYLPRTCGALFVLKRQRTHARKESIMAYSARNVGSTGERVALDIVSWSSSEEAKAKASERAEAAVHLAEMLGHRVHVKSRPGLYACTIEDDTGEHEMVAMQLSHRSKDVWFVPTNPRAAKEFHHVFGLEWKNIDLTTRP